MGVDGRMVDYLGSTPLVDLPPELAIREVPRLGDDLESLVEFTNEYGPLTQQKGHPEGLLPKRFRTLSEKTEAGMGPIPVQVVLRHVRVLRALIEHWGSFQDEYDDGVIAAWELNGFNPPSGPEEAWGWWAEFLNNALRPFQAQVVVTREDDQALPYGWERPVVSVYAALALQIFNDVATGTAWKTCANETCRRLFVRQFGRASVGQNRSTGIKYCSAKCAKAQVQREQRRKGKARG